MPDWCHIFKLIPTLNSSVSPNAWSFFSKRVQHNIAAIWWHPMWKLEKPEMRTIRLKFCWERRCCSFFFFFTTGPVSRLAPRPRNGNGRLLDEASLAAMSCCRTSIHGACPIVARGADVSASTYSTAGADGASHRLESVRVTASNPCGSTQMSNVAIAYLSRKPSSWPFVNPVRNRISSLWRLWLVWH